MTDGAIAILGTGGTIGNTETGRMPIEESLEAEY
jgi:hypothetical protein